MISLYHFSTHSATHPVDKFSGLGYTMMVIIEFFMPIKLYNTMSRQIEEFKPIKKGRVGLYTCGPTVYNFAHIGNLRTYVFEDILKRVLKFNGLKVKHVMNITDVGHLTSDADEGDDKMEKGAIREGKTAWQIADFYTEAFRSDMQELNIEEPDIWCRATEYVKEQIGLIKKLEKKGFTYQTLDGIYFDTTKLADYGKLANLKKQDLRAGVRVGVGDKINPADFALWKFSPPLVKRQMEWDSPWGIGFPGWHVECSAMATKHLGQPFDIHCGGIDHVPVHHTNEIAQSEAAEGTALANYWMHGEFLIIANGDKMAKSGDNFLTLQVLKNKSFGPLSYRYLLLQTHYRKQLMFSWDAVASAQTGLERLVNAIAHIPTVVDGAQEKKFIEQFISLINDDLNIPEALGLLWNALNKKIIGQKTAFLIDEVLGLDLKRQIARLSEPKSDLPDSIKMLIAERDRARANKDWRLSDELREKLETLGYNVKDTNDGAVVTSNFVS
ncbi:MAG: cysteine--tRNA ligase [Candidatus Magasanikbacteria bacterium]